MIMGVRRWSPRIGASLARLCWGGLLLVFDFPVQFGSFRVDLLNDVLGMLLITSGVFRLAKYDISGTYRNLMDLVKLICVLTTVRELVDLQAFETAPTVELVGTACTLAGIAGIVLFLAAMRLLFSWMALVDSVPRRPQDDESCT